MFDFSQIAKVGETLEQATRDLDSRLEQIANLLTKQNEALAMILDRMPIEPFLMNNDDVVLAMQEAVKLLADIEKELRWKR